jgi:acetylornithine deacetylase
MTAAPTTRELVEKLVSFDTTSRDSNLHLIRFVEGYLTEAGVASKLIYDETGAKANLFATVGPEIDGGVVLSGHTDVVPVDGQDWSSDPFRCIARDGRLFGRGTSDMKSFIASCLALLPEMRKAKLKLPLHFAFSYDEEVGCLGVDGIVRHIEGMTTRPQAVIVGEPTMMKVVNAHKGVCAIDTVVTGLEAHSSATNMGVNSVFYAAELVNCIAKLAEEAKSAARNERFDPPYTTVHVGAIRGGTARNIIPKETTIHWEYRALPGVDGRWILERFERFAREEVLPRMRAVHPGAEIRTVVGAEIRPLMPEKDSAAEALVRALTGANQSYAVAYGTEAGAFQQAGVPTVVCGPGDIAQAHKPDEFIALAQLDACDDFLRKLIRHMAA